MSEQLSLLERVLVHEAQQEAALARKARTKRRRPKLVPIDYPPGHFSAGAIAWLGPLGWVPSELPRSGNVTNRSSDVPKRNGGWRDGTIVGLSEKADRMLAERGR